MDLSPSLSRIQSRNPAQSRNPIRSLNRLRQNLRPLTRYNQQGGQNSQQKHGKPLERGLHDVVNSFLNQLSWHVTYPRIGTKRTSFLASRNGGTKIECIERVFRTDESESTTRFDRYGL